MYENLKAANLKRWQAMQVNPSAVAELDLVAKRLIAAKDKYVAVEAATGVPWPVIAVIHEREASQSWKANLAQGDPWNQVSTHEPAGQGPFESWQAAAINALKYDGLITWKDWSIEGSLTALEKYNGLGYFNKGKPSPYLWSKSNQYTSGKYVADGVYSATTVDKQDGCVPLLYRMMVLDSTINAKYKWITRVGAGLGAAGAILTTGAVAVSQTPYHYWPWIIGGSIIAAITTGVAVHLWRNHNG